MTSRTCAARRAIAVFGTVVVVALAMACGDDGEVGPTGPSAVGASPAPLASMAGNRGQQGTLSGSGGMTSSLGPQGPSAFVGEREIRMASDDVDISIHSPIITSPECGSTITVFSSVDDDYEWVTVLLDWETNTITGLYFYMEGPTGRLAEGRSNVTGLFSIRASSYWLDDNADAYIELTLVGETATATYPSGTGPGTKIVFRTLAGSGNAPTGCQRAEGQNAAGPAHSFSDSASIYSLASSGSPGEHVILVDVVDPDPITATFSNVPTSHDGSTFTFDLGFAPEPEISFRVLKFHAFEVEGGSIYRTPRKVRGSNETWTVHVTPSGTGDVTITLPATTDCDDNGAICTGDGGMLNHSTTATVPGP